MNTFGFLNINKPKGITSHDVIYKLRKIFGIKKIGHAGTLDPLASGVLPVAISDSTRLLEYLEDDKKYVAYVKFGQSSATYDEEGEKSSYIKPSFIEEDLLAALGGFKGKISQKPPIYSAIKIKGKKLYEFARKGIETPEIPLRQVEVFDINLLCFKNESAEVEIHCSSGTYIRSIAHDLGQKLGCGAYLADLTRTSSGGFDIKNSVDIENVKIENIINPLEVIRLPKYEISENNFKKVENGNSIELSGEDGKIILTHLNKLVAIGNLSANIVKMEKVFKMGAGK